MSRRAKAHKRERQVLMARQATTINAILDVRLFREFARSQRCCQNPGCKRPTAPWDAHHVLYEQELRRLGLPIYDKRNSLRLCKRCHAMHHSRTGVLTSRALTDGHIAFVRSALGDGADDYLRIHYDTHEDPRIP